MKIIDTTNGAAGDNTKVLISNIEWDVEMDTDVEAPDADLIDERLKENGLPDTVLMILPTDADITDLDSIMDELSRETGFCVTNMDVEQTYDDADIDWDKVGALMEDSGLVQDEASGMWQFEEEDEDEEDGIAIYGDYLSRGEAACDLWTKLWYDLDEVREDLRNAAEQST